MELALHSAAALKAAGYRVIKVLKEMPRGGPRIEVYQCEASNGDRVVVKAVGPEREGCLRNEYSTLKRLSGRRAGAVRAPRAIGLHRSNDVVLLAVEFIESEPYCCDEGDALLILVSGMKELGGAAVNMHAFWRPTDLAGLLKLLKTPEAKARAESCWDAAPWFQKSLKKLNTNASLVLAHNDLSLQNAIYGRHPQDASPCWFLVDWEYAGYANIYADAASALLWHAREHFLQDPSQKIVFPWSSNFLATLIAAYNWGNQDVELLTAQVVLSVIEKLDFHYSYKHEKFDEFSGILSYYERLLTEGTRGPAI